MNTKLASILGKGMLASLLLCGASSAFGQIANAPRVPDAPSLDQGPRSGQLGSSSYGTTSYAKRSTGNVIVVGHRVLRGGFIKTQINTPGGYDPYRVSRVGNARFFNHLNRPTYVFSSRNGYVPMH